MTTQPPRWNPQEAAQPQQPPVPEPANTPDNEWHSSSSDDFVEDSKPLNEVVAEMAKVPSQAQSGMPTALATTPEQAVSTGHVTRAANIATNIAIVSYPGPDDVGFRGKGFSETSVVDGIVIGVVYGRTYYEGKYMPGSAAKPPDCSSTDRHHGVMSVEMAERAGQAFDGEVLPAPDGSCAVCPLNTWGPKNEAPKCRIYTGVFVLTQGATRPIMLRLPPSCDRDWTGYVQFLGGEEILPGAVTRFDVSKRAGTRGGVEITALQAVPQQSLGRVNELAGEFLSQMVSLGLNPETMQKPSEEQAGVTWG